MTPAGSFSEHDLETRPQDVSALPLLAAEPLGLDLTPGPVPIAATAGLGSVRTILRNSTLNLAAQGVNALGNLMVVFVLGHGPSKQAMGEYWTLFALITAVQLVCEAGLSTLLTSRIAQDPRRWREIVVSGSGLFALVVLLSFLALFGLGAAWAAWKGHWDVLPAFIAAAVTCGAIQTQRFCAGVFRAFDQFGNENIGRMLQGTLFAGLVIGLAAAGWVSVFALASMLAVSHVVAAAYFLIAFERRYRCLQLSFNRVDARAWLAEAVPLGFGDVVRQLTWQLDTLLLGLLQPAWVVGVYSVAYRPLGPLNWLPRTVLTAAFPAFSRMAVGDRDELERSFANSTRLLWIISLPLAIIICACAEPMIVFLAGEKYLEAATPMRILIWVTSVSFLSIQFRFLFAAVGRQRLFAQIVAATFVLQVLLEFSLIPWFGYFGACAGTVIGEVLFTAGGLFACHRLGMTGIPWRALARALIAGGAMGGVLYLAQQGPLSLLLAALIPATLLYLALCIALRALRWSEVEHMFDMLRHLRRRK